MISQSMLRAQTVSDLPTLNLSGQSVITFDGRYEGVKGTYTLFEEFRPGKVELVSGKFSNVLINYDAYGDNLVAKNAQMKDAVMMRKDMVLSFGLNDSGEEYLFIKRNVSGKPTFLLDLVRDSISLFCKISKTIKKANVGGAYNTTETRYDEFIITKTFYVSKRGGELIEMQKFKKAVLETFPEYEDQLSDYIKKNKVDYKDHNQMKLLVEYINTLRK